MWDVDDVDLTDSGCTPLCMIRSYQIHGCNYLYIHFIHVELHPFIADAPALQQPLMADPEDSTVWAPRKWGYRKMNPQSPVINPEKAYPSLDMNLVPQCNHVAGYEMIFDMIFAMTP